MIIFLEFNINLFIEKGGYQDLPDKIMFTASTLTSANPSAGTSISVEELPVLYTTFPFITLAIKFSCPGKMPSIPGSAGISQKSTFPLNMTPSRPVIFSLSAICYSLSLSGGGTGVPSGLVRALVFSTSSVEEAAAATGTVKVLAFSTASSIVPTI